MAGKRTSREREDDKLQVGDECWLLNGTLMHNVTITEVRGCLEDTPQSFTMYRVKSAEGFYHIDEHSQHRADLFRKPTEVDELRDRIESEIQSLNYLYDDLEDVGEVEDSEESVE